MVETKNELIITITLVDLLIIVLPIQCLDETHSYDHDVRRPILRVN